MVQKLVDNVQPALKRHCLRDLPPDEAPYVLKAMVQLRVCCREAYQDVFDQLATALDEECVTVTAASKCIWAIGHIVNDSLPLKMC